MAQSVPWSGSCIYNIRIQSALQHLFEELAPKYADRQGGYTRILKTMPRRGDGAPMVILEFVD